VGCILRKILQGSMVKYSIKDGYMNALVNYGVISSDEHLQTIIECIRENIDRIMEQHVGN